MSYMGCDGSSSSRCPSFVASFEVQLWRKHFEGSALLAPEASKIEGVRDLHFVRFHAGEVFFVGNIQILNAQSSGEKKLNIFHFIVFYGAFFGGVDSRCFLFRHSGICSKI